MNHVERHAYAVVAGRALHVHVRRPAGRGPFAGLIDVHGGAWTHFDPEVNFYWCRELARRGWVTCSVEFRQAPAHPWPAPISDVRAATRWVRAHAAELDLDPDRLGAIGGSTGGHLATLLGLVPDPEREARTEALDTPETTSARVAWVVALWPILDVVGRYRMTESPGGSWLERRVAARLHARRRDAASRGQGSVQVGLARVIARVDALRGASPLLGDVAGGAVQWALARQGSSGLGRALVWPVLREAHEGAFADERQMEDASPLAIVSGGRAQHLPPMHVVQGLCDSNLTPDMTRRFAAAYALAGGRIETHFPARLGHSFGNVPSRAADRLVADVAAFSARASSRSRSC